MGAQPDAPRRRFTRLRRLLARRKPLSCQEMVELVTDYLEDALAPKDRARFEHHLDACDGCATYLQELHVTIGVLGVLTEERIDPVFRDRLMEAFAETTGSW